MVQLIRRAERALRVGAGPSDRLAWAPDVDAIADGKAWEARADRFNLAGAVDTGCVRQRRFSRVRAAVQVQVHWIDTGRAHADDGLSVTWCGIGDLFEAQDVRTAECTNDNGAHGRMLS